MNVRFFHPGRSYQAIKEEIDSEMQRVLAAGDLILRADVDKFEENLAKYVGTKYAVSLASGTDAIGLTLQALGFGTEPNQQVIIPSYTFRATVEAAHNFGLDPMLTDMGEDWSAKRTMNTRVIIPAHIAGEVMDWEPTESIIMIEDACQAIGAAPVKGIAACYSFYPAKILGCYGDAGAVATNDKDLYDELLKLRNHYKGDWSKVGQNSRMDNLQAAVLNVKIKYLPQYIARRKEIAEMYDAYLRGVRLPKKREVYQDYIIEHPNRDGLKNCLSGHGIETMENGYPFPSAYPKGPLTLAYEAHSLRLPCYPELTNEEVLHVIKHVNGARL